MSLACIGGVVLYLNQVPKVWLMAKTFVYVARRSDSVMRMWNRFAYQRRAAVPHTSPRGSQ